MAKFYGKIGFGVQVETAPGVWLDDVVEHYYYGNIMRNTRNLQSAAKVNDDLTVNVQISIIADPYATENFHTIQYVEYMNAKWKVASVDVQYPRLVLTLGGLYR